MMSIEEMQNIDVRTVDPETLVDIRTVKIDQSLSREEREAEFIRQVKNPYCFRVGDVYKNCAIATYFDDELISKRKRPVMAPGEMEQVILQKSKLADYPDLKHITIKIEEA